MARPITVIQQQIFDSITSDDRLTSLNSTSRVAIYRLIIFIISYSIWLFETILDQHKTEIDTAIYEQKSATKNWYKNMSLSFQYGFDLLVDSDKFDNTGYTIDQIEASKIIKYCSVKESLESNRLTIKVAGESGTVLEPLSGSEKESFEQYLSEIKYAGVKITVINNPADKLVLYMQIYRDALIIDENGISKLDGGRPVETAINAYMKALPFDGELVINDLIEKLRAVPGVNNAHIVNATSTYFDSVDGTYTNHAPINVKTIPISGYFQIDNYDTVSYVV
jgi:hypothetical protein